MPIRQALSSIVHEGGSEFGEASVPQRAMLGVTACTLAFEWGTGNEALLGLVAGNVLRNTHNTLLTAAVAGGTSFTEQSVFGISAAISIHNFPRVMDAIRRNVYRNSEEPIARSEQVEAAIGVDTSNESRISKLRTLIAARFLTAFAIGTSLSALKDNAAEKRTLPENVKSVAIDASLISGGVMGIAAAAAGVTNAGRAIGLQQEAGMFVDVIASPYTYLGLFGIKSSLDFRAWRRRNHRNEDQEPEPTFLERKDTNDLKPAELQRLLYETCELPDGAARALRLLDAHVPRPKSTEDNLRELARYDAYLEPIAPAAIQAGDFQTAEEVIDRTYDWFGPGAAMGGGGLLEATLSKNDPNVTAAILTLILRKWGNGRAMDVLPEIHSDLDSSVASTIGQWLKDVRTKLGNGSYPYSFDKTFAPNLDSLITLYSKI